MSCEQDRYDLVCKGAFAELHQKLDRVDDAIRGNGHIGILRRLDRLEQAQAQRSRMNWTLLGAFASAGASALLSLLQLLLRH